MWSISRDHENFYGVFDTIEAALLEALPGNLVGECELARQPEDVPDFADIILEHIAVQDDYCFEAAEGWYADATGDKAACDELNNTIREVFARWLDKHDLRPKFFLVPNPVDVTQEMIVSARAAIESEAK